MITLPDPVKAGLANGAAGGCTVGAGLVLRGHTPVWLVVSLAALASVPWWLATMARSATVVSDAAAYIMDRWRPLPRGKRRLPEAQCPPPVLAPPPASPAKLTAIDDKPKAA